MIVFFDFIGKRKIFYVISVLMIIAGLVSLAVQGLNLGIDFTGGTVLQISVDGVNDVGQVRDAMAKEGHGSDQIQQLEDGTYQIKTAFMDQEAQDALLNSVRDSLGNTTLVQSYSVGPSMGQEIFNKAVIALIVAIVLMIGYITFRFEWRFALSGIISLFHDILITVGMFSIFQWEVNASFVAAILTIFGYSINDTIVIFDRIREHLGKIKKDELAATVNMGIMSTMRRSIYTSVSTLIPLWAIFLLGGDTTKNFVLAMIIGITSGVYSSIFNAAPLWYDMSMHSKKRRF